MKPRQPGFLRSLFASFLISGPSKRPPVRPRLRFFVFPDSGSPSRSAGRTSRAAVLGRGQAVGLTPGLPGASGSSATTASKARRQGPRRLRPSTTTSGSSSAPSQRQYTLKVTDTCRDREATRVPTKTRPASSPASATRRRSRGRPSAADRSHETVSGGGTEIRPESRGAIRRFVLRGRGGEVRIASLRQSRRPPSRHAKLPEPHDPLSACRLPVRLQGELARLARRDGLGGEADPAGQTSRATSGSSPTATSS